MAPNGRSEGPVAFSPKRSQSDRPAAMSDCNLISGFKQCAVGTGRLQDNYQNDRLIIAR